MRDKWASSGAAGILDQHRGFDFHEIALVEEVADLPDDLRPLLKCRPDVPVHDEVQIPLTVPDVSVLKAMELLRQRNQVLGEQRNLICVDRDLAHLRAEHRTLHTDDVADIVLFEILVGILANLIARHVNLNAVIAVQDIAERGLAHDTLGHHTAGNRHFLPFHLLKVILDVGGVLCLVVGRDPERILSFLLQGLQLLSPDLQKLIEVLLSAVLSLVRHFLPVLRQFLTADFSPRSGSHTR